MDEEDDVFVQLRVKPVSASKIFKPKKLEVPPGKEIALDFKLDLTAVPLWVPGHTHYVREHIAGNESTPTEEWKKKYPGRSVGSFQVKKLEEFE